MTCRFPSAVAATAKDVLSKILCFEGSTDNDVEDGAEGSPDGEPDTIGAVLVEAPEDFFAATPKPTPRPMVMPPSRSKPTVNMTQKYFLFNRLSAGSSLPFSDIVF